MDSGDQTTMDLDSGGSLLGNMPPTFDKKKAVRRWEYALVFVIVVIVVRVAIFYMLGR